MISYRVTPLITAAIAFPMLALDEICDGGIILEADPSAVAMKVAIRTDDIPLGEQTVAQVSKS